MALSISLDQGRAACAESVSAFVGAVGGLDELELLGASRCHGWARLDVVVHVIGGWQELLGGLVSPVDDAPTVDAASYWTAFSAAAGEDRVADVVAQRRRTASYARPSAALAQLRDVADALQRGIASCVEGCLTWQGEVFTSGDLLTTWAVEDVVHQLDLDVEHPLPTGALALARRTVEDLLGASLGTGWSDAEVVLTGTGRTPAPSDLGPLAARLPVLG